MTSLIIVFCDFFSIVKECQLCLQISKSILEKTLFCTVDITNVYFVCTRAELRCRHGVWDLNTFRVSLVPFRIGEGSSFSLIMGPFESEYFKDVHLMNPEPPNIFHRVLCRMKKRKERWPMGCENIPYKV